MNDSTNRSNGGVKEDIVASLGRTTFFISAVQNGDGAMLLNPMAKELHKHLMKTYNRAVAEQSRAADGLREALLYIEEIVQTMSRSSNMFRNSIEAKVPAQKLQAVLLTLATPHRK